MAYRRRSRRVRSRMRSRRGYPSRSRSRRSSTRALRIGWRM